MPRTRGLAHVNLNVSDVDRSARFYGAVLGMVVVSDVTETVEKDGQQVEVRQALLSTPERSDLLALTHGAAFPVGRGGLNHIGFLFESDEDVRAAIREVERYGGELRKHGDRSDGGVSEAFAYVRDPDGYDVELSTQAIALASATQTRRHESR